MYFPQEPTEPSPQIPSRAGAGGRELPKPLGCGGSGARELRLLPSCILRARPCPPQITQIPSGSGVGGRESCSPTTLRFGGRGSGVRSCASPHEPSEPSPQIPYTTSSPISRSLLCSVFSYLLFLSLSLFSPLPGLPFLSLSPLLSVGVWAPEGHSLGPPRRSRGLRK